MTHNIYRFKFTDDVMESITQFSKIHQFEERNDYKESWEEWCKDNIELIEIPKLLQSIRSKSASFTNLVIDFLLKNKV